MSSISIHRQQMIPPSTRILRLKGMLRKSFAEFSAEEVIDMLSLSIDEIFGHSSLDLDVYRTHQAAIDAEAKEKGWEIEVGRFSVAFFRGKDRPKLVFGERPDKKTMKVMVKENKNKPKQHDSI